MKRTLLILATVLVGFMTSCSYDDSEVWNAIDQMQQEQEEMQAQLDAQQALLNALANNLSIISITEIEGGYQITFSDNSTITIMHGEDGADGADGKDGADGEDGANGADGADGADGKDGKDGADGDSFFGGVTWDDEYVYITLADGTEVVIPIAQVPTNEIWYTSSDNSVVVPYYTDGFGATLLSNTYENGRGTMVFDGDVTEIGYSAFSDCTTLATISIPKSVSVIEDHGFQGCSGLTDITIPESVTVIESGAFAECKSLTTITLPNGIKLIDTDTFWLCESLKEINIPNSVTTISDGAFGHCFSLTSVTIPESVTEIGYQAFWNCISLLEVYCKSPTPIEAKIMLSYSPVPTEWDTFKYHNSELKIYVPTEIVDDYKVAWGWSDYADLIVGYDF